MKYLAAAAALSLSVAVQAPAVAQTMAVDVAPFVAHEIHPKIHVLGTPDDYFGPVIGNVTLIQQRDGYVLVDSGLTAGNGRAVVRYARSLSTKPIKAVIITHWHNDHPQGVSAIRAAFPKVRIISTRETESGMRGPEAFDVGYSPGPKWDAAMAATVASNKEQLQKLHDAPDTAPDRKERIRKALASFDQFLKDYPGTFIVLPTETFERRLVIGDPEIPVEILHLGKANTNGDAIAWLPKQKIVATGDIVVAPSPFGFGSFSGDWIETIGKVRALGYSTLIPGHGQPQRDGAYLDKLVALLSDMRAQIIPLAQAGMPLEEVRKKVDFSKSVEQFGLPPRFKPGLEGNFLNPMTGSIFKEALGQPIAQGEGSPEPSLPRDTPPKSTSKHHKS